MRGFPGTMMEALWQGYRPGPNDIAAVDQSLEQAAVRIVPITAEIARSERYGKSPTRDGAHTG